MKNSEILLKIKETVNQKWQNNNRHFECKIPEDEKKPGFCWCSKFGYAEAKSYLGHTLGNVGTTVWSWNDEKTRTKDQVLTMFEQAIKLAKKDEK